MGLAHSKNSDDMLRYSFSDHPMLFKHSLSLDNIKGTLKLIRLWRCSWLNGCPKISSMQRHILRVTFVTAYKRFHGYLNLPMDEFFEAPFAWLHRGHNFKVRQPRFRLAIWSAGARKRLPPHISEAAMVSIFKDRLDVNWSSIFPTLFDPTSVIVFM